MKLEASSVLAAIAGLLPLSGFAQQAASLDSDELQEIVVTAEKRSENIQEVPITITAFSKVSCARKV
jgi:iron complex outermembrane receptor protein